MANLTEDMNLQIQEAEQIPNRIKEKKNPCQNTAKLNFQKLIIKLLKSNKETILKQPERSKILHGKEHQVE